MSSGKLATKYGKVFADKIGIKGEFGPSGIDDASARNAFYDFMSKPGNEDTAPYMNIAHQLYFFHSLADVRSLEHWLGFGIRPPKHYVDLINAGYKDGSTLPVFRKKLPHDS